jgi:tetratricopeptide (TPR) repeat protein
VAEGNAGAGTGATVGKLRGAACAMKGGLGCATAALGDVIVGALVAVNAVGDVRDPETGRLIAGTRNAADGLLLIDTAAALAAGAPAPRFRPVNTTIGVVATTAALGKEEATRLAQFGMDGFARALSPPHLPSDGDALFALSIGDARADLLALGAVAARESAAPPAYFEAMDANLTRNWAPLTAVATRDYKLIDLPDAELYSLREDPHETVNLFARNAERARTLEALLRGMTTTFQSRGSSGEKTTLSPDARQRLQALGYVASSADPGTRVYTAADDPKTLIGVSNDLDRAVKAFNSGSRAEAMTAVRTIVREHPSFSTAQGQLASMQRQSGDLPGAIATLEEMVRRGIADQRLMIVLADYIAASGALPKALGLLEAVIAAHPDEVEAHNSLGVVAMRMGQHDRARQAFGKVLDLDPTSATAYANLGADALSSGDLQGAIGHLTRALELDPRQYTVLYNLAMALDGLGRRDEARRDMERFINEAPPQRFGREIAEFRTLLRR